LRDAAGGQVLFLKFRGFLIGPSALSKACQFGADCFFICPASSSDISYFGDCLIMSGEFRKNSDKSAEHCQLKSLLSVKSIFATSSP